MFGLVTSNRYNKLLKDQVTYARNVLFGLGN